MQTNTPPPFAPKRNKTMKSKEKRRSIDLCALLWSCFASFALGSYSGEAQAFDQSNHS